MALPEQPSIAQARRHYADEVRLAAGLHSDALVEAFATVQRELFLGPGPWDIAVPPRHVGEAPRYERTPDGDPRHLCHNILVAIDRERMLNNGLPSFLGFQIEAARIGPSDRVAHIGCGVGYYTAIIASLAPNGRVLAIETDAELAERSRQNLKDWPNVEVVSADGTTFDPGESDVIFVNAGVTHPATIWLDRLAELGRLILPLTHRKDEMTNQGILLLVERGREMAARAISQIHVYDCVGGRDDRWNDSLGAALTRGNAELIRSLRPADHAPIESCWLHVADVCLSTETANENPTA